MEQVEHRGKDIVGKVGAVVFGPIAIVLGIFVALYGLNDFGFTGGWTYRFPRFSPLMEGVVFIAAGFGLLALAGSFIDDAFGLAEKTKARGKVGYFGVLIATLVIVVMFTTANLMGLKGECAGVTTEKWGDARPKC